MDRLVEETAYEHWHRMFFARFLEAKDLLIYRSSGGPVPVTLEDCESLALMEKAEDGWEFTARCVARMLPGIFRAGSPAFELLLPPESRQDLSKIIAELPPEVFVADDSMGWCYQQWQSRRKNEVNDSEVKIGERELPSVTQLFSEPYMVSFLLDNTLGAWRAARKLPESVLATAQDEGELRRLAGLPGVPLAWLRFVRDGEGPWGPAAGTFARWPDSLADFRLLDPCCGSGHFLVAAFNMLVPMRMADDGLSASEAVDAVLRDNIHGLEIDRRCAEIAAFSLALAAWTYPDAGGYRELPPLNIACSGIAVGAKKENWTALARGDAKLYNTLGWLYDAFRLAPVLGSLIDPEETGRGSGMIKAEWSDARPLLDMALAAESYTELTESAVAAKGIAEAALLLSRQYTLIATNVPYLSAGKHHPTLKKFCQDNYREAKGDLATVFLDRCLKLCPDGGTVAAVTPQNWLSLTSYTKFRERLLKDCRWHLDALLGSDAFVTPMWTFNIQLIIMSKGAPESFVDGTDAEGAFIRFVNASALKGPASKSLLLADSEVASVSQAMQLSNPDKRVSAEEIGSGELLELSAIANQGIKTGDDPLYKRCFWERVSVDSGWQLYQSTVGSLIHYGGRTSIIDWSQHGTGMACPRPNNKNVGTRGVAVSQMGDLAPTIYTGELFDSNVGPISPLNQDHLAALWCYCSSPEYNEAVRKIDQKLNVTNATLVKVPFDLDLWTQVANERYPHGLPAPYSDNPAQWIFHGHPCGSVIWNDASKRLANGPLRTDGTVLQVAVARLLGYRWPAELAPDMELAGEQRQWVRRCEELAGLVDRDGIVAIPAVTGDANAADRLLNILIASYGDGWSNGVLSRLLAASDHPNGTLESWLRDKFFAQHCKLFKDRPFIWHIWDGLRDGFSALVNYHKLNYNLLYSLTFNYLRDWIARQRYDLKNNVEGAERRMIAAENLRHRLKAILGGEAPHDIFVRWKPLEEQPIGWNPDINDGVRLNIRPFMTEHFNDDKGDNDKKGVCILRHRPNVSYGKDRGKDAESAPWYHLDKGDRINDRHLTIAEKEKARS
jgi:hypothetical protein